MRAVGGGSRNGGARESLSTLFLGGMRPKFREGLLRQEGFVPPMLYAPKETTEDSEKGQAAQALGAEMKRNDYVQLIGVIAAMQHFAELLLLEVGALRRLLIARGIVTTEELQEASAEHRARVAVEIALDPELSKAQQELRELWQKILGTTTDGRS